MPPSAPAGLPTRAALKPDGLYLALQDIPPTELKDAFLQQTVQRLPARATVAHVPLAELGRMPPGSAPAGIVFHVGRCGSTLISQLLRQLDDIAVYAEPLALNEILVPPHAWDRAGRVAAVRTLGAFLARHAGRPYVLKCSSWNTLYCELIAEAFPATPWALSSRDPVEVCVSLLKERPGWLRDAGQPAQLFADVVDPERASTTPEEFLARLLGAYCRAVARLDPARGLLVHYEALPEVVWSVLARHFGLPVSAPLQARMVEASRAYSKAPVGQAVAFTPDGARKRAAASPALLGAIDAYARPELARLMARLPA